MTTQSNEITYKNSQDISSKWKASVRRYPRFTRFLQFVFDPAYVSHAARDQRIEALPEDAIILNIGSGVKKFPRKCVNIDIEAFGNVSVVADAQRLPLKDGSVDFCLLEYTVEHVPDSSLMRLELWRVLKPGGYLYATVPFMQSYHANPDDYYRYTTSGFPLLFKNFEPVACAPFGGPTSALCNAVKEYLAIVLSFGNRFLYALLSQLLIIPVWPFKFLDIFIIRNPNAKNYCFSLYFIGKKVN